MDDNQNYWSGQDPQEETQQDFHTDDQYQNNQYQGNQYQDNTYQNNQYQNGAYQNNQYQNGAYQNNQYQNGTYQNNQYQNQPYQQYQGNYQNYQPYSQPPQMDLEEPMKLSEWIITMLIMMIPCVNIVMIFVWAFSQNEKKSKSNFFKASLIMAGIFLIIYILFAIVLVAIFGISHF